MGDTYDPAIHHRRSVRLQGYDYAAAGAYFLTLGVQGRHHLFGEIVGGEMLLNDLGTIVAEEWARTPDVRREVVLDASVVMPNHLHGIVLIDANHANQAHKPRAAVPRTERMPHAPTMWSPARTVGSLMRGFKAAVTRRAGALCGTTDIRVWQRNYYEHIIRDDRGLERIRAYIANNPLRWAEDDYNTEDRP